LFPAPPKRWGSFFLDLAEIIFFLRRSGRESLFFFALVFFSLDECFPKEGFPTQKSWGPPPPCASPFSLKRWPPCLFLFLGICPLPLQRRGQGQVFPLFFTFFSSHPPSSTGPAFFLKKGFRFKGPLLFLSQEMNLASPLSFRRGAFFFFSSRLLFPNSAMFFLKMEPLFFFSFSSGFFSLFFRR